MPFLFILSAFGWKLSAGMKTKDVKIPDDAYFFRRISLSLQAELIYQPMYDQQINEGIFYLMFYASVMMFNLIASCYLLFRRANAIVPDVTPPQRLRRCTAAFFITMSLSHLWYLPSMFLTSSEDIELSYYIATMLDFMLVYSLAIAIMLAMLQDRRRPLWPAAVMVAPLVIGVAVYLISRSDVLLSSLYVYLLLLGIGLLIYMVRAMRQYGLWLRDNYADLENKEVWQCFVILVFFLLAFGLYTFEPEYPIIKYITQVNNLIVVSYLLWRAETLSDLSQFDSKSVSTSVPSETIDDDLSSAVQDKIGQLLQKHCVSTQLYLQHDLNSQQLAQAIGTNRFYLSQYFSSRGLHYNDYINELRIQHFISLYHKAIDDNRDFTVQQLAQECGYHSYSTFSRAFKQQTGKNVTTWMGDTDE